MQSNVYSDEAQRSFERALHARFEIFTIGCVEESEDSWVITTEQGFGFFVKKKLATIKLEKGQEVKVYKSRNGCIQGVDVDGKELFFKTQAELEAERLEALAKIEEENIKMRQSFAKERTDPSSDFNRRFGALPKVFRQRFARFFRLGDNFCDHAWYELQACEAAIHIAHVCKSWQGIRRFRNSSYENQQQPCPVFTELSGNQAEFACAIASVYLRNPKWVIRVRGALSPLVGSKPYIGR